MGEIRLRSEPIDLRARFWNELNSYLKVPLYFDLSTFFLFSKCSLDLPLALLLLGTVRVFLLLKASCLLPEIVSDSGARQRRSERGSLAELAGSSQDVGAFFEAGTVVRYSLVHELTAATSTVDGRDLGPSQLTEMNLTQEVVSFSFSTSSTPSILLYISSWSRDYMAVVLQHNGTLQLCYNLGGLDKPFTIELDQRNLANGQPHNVNMTRTEQEIHIQLDHYPTVSYTLPEKSDTEFTLVKAIHLGKVYETDLIDPVLVEKYNTPGFVGCLSRVQFNRIAPLKAALRSPLSLRVSHQGKLIESNCGSSPLTISPMSAATESWLLDEGANFPFNEEIVIPDGLNRNSAVIGGIIAMVIFSILCILVFLIRYVFQHKGTYHTNESKEAKRSESADEAIIASELNLTETIDENKKEWFI